MREMLSVLSGGGDFDDGDGGGDDGGVDDCGAGEDLVPNERRRHIEENAAPVTSRDWTASA